MKPSPLTHRQAEGALHFEEASLLFARAVIRRDIVNPTARFLGAFAEEGSGDVHRSVNDRIVRTTPCATGWTAAVPAGALSTRRWRGEGRRVIGDEACRAGFQFFGVALHGFKGGIRSILGRPASVAIVHCGVPFATMLTPPLSSLDSPLKTPKSDKLL